MFYIVGFTIALACSIITIKTLIGYGDFKAITKWLVSLIVIIGWFAPLWLGALRKYTPITGELLSWLHIVGYCLFGVTFILFSVLIARDVLWFSAYGLSKIFNFSNEFLNPKNAHYLYYANIFASILVIVISLHAFHEGSKLAPVKEVAIHDNKIIKPFNIVLVTDLHVSRIDSSDHVAAVVNRVNELNPDVILLAGDIIDDNFGMEEQLKELGKLKAKHGVYFSLGNHEVYRGYAMAITNLSHLGFKILINKGEHVSNTNIFISGIPDYGTSKTFPALVIKFDEAMKGSKPTDYRILMSHNPQFIDHIADKSIDLQVSGHTHGGQIFPFHLLAKYENHYLAGLYNVNNMLAYVSRGTGTWGPPMRLFAPSEITLITLQP